MTVREQQKTGRDGEAGLTIRSEAPSGRRLDSSLQARSEVRDGMRIDWDVPIAMDDGLVLRADVFRPIAEGRYPVILTYGPYAKGLAFQDGYPSAWERMVRRASGRRRRLEQQLPELGGGRSGEMGAGRLCLRARRFAAAPAARRASSTTSRRARPRTSTTASNGPACSPGRTARSG